MTNIIQLLANDISTVVDDEVFCSILDLGIDPGTAYNAVYIDAPLSAYERFETDIDPIALEDHDDLDVDYQ